VPTNSTIKHIVVLMMENRSFDHLLGLLKRENSEIRGVVGGDYANSNTAGTAKIAVTDGAAYQGQLINDAGHDFTDVYMQMYGVPFGTANAPKTPDMSGFVKSYEGLGGNPAVDIMRCFDPTQLPVLCGLAREYAICDQWFSSVPGPTLPNRAFAHFGTSFGRLDMSPDYFRSKPSIYQRLAAAGKRGMIYYYSPSSGTLGMSFLVSDQKKYFGLWGDFKSACLHDKLPDYCFVEPCYGDDGGTLAADQHPDHSVSAGDSFIRQVYQAIRSNNNVWNSTVLLLVWDEHGGIFDHEIPPMVGHPDGFISQDPAFNFDRLGVRVPAVVISPYVQQGTVDHTVYEHASIPATVTEQFISNPKSNPPYARESAANTFLHLLALDQPRTDSPNLDGPSTPAISTAGKAASALLKNQVQDLHAVLARNYPQQSQALDPATVQTEGDATKFIASAMATIHPETNKGTK
jgi:phospholipase C